MTLFHPTKDTAFSQLAVMVSQEHRFAGILFSLWVLITETTVPLHC